MRIFLAGASGAIGIRLVPLLVAGGHVVAAMTRTAQKLDQLRALGAEPVLCDVYDPDALRSAVIRFRPDAVMHQLTDLPDDAARIPELSARNDRMRTEGTRSLLAAAGEAKAGRVLAQSIAWRPPGSRGITIDQHEQAVLGAGGVVIRYGQLYGPGTYFEADEPAPPRIHVDEAARRTVPLITSPAGIVEVVEQQSSPGQHDTDP